MNNLSNIKLDELQRPNKLLWYITPQACDFVVLAYAASILESWNPSKDKQFKVYFDKTKKQPPYNQYIATTDYRAIKNCEYVGLMRPSSDNKAQYSANNLTQLYYDIKKICNSQFYKINLYQKQVDKALLNMEVPVGLGSGFFIKPVPYTLKVILGIGDITDKYYITLEEFKLFVCTSKEWKEYVSTEAAILKFRTDPNFKAECQSKYKDSDIQHMRINIPFSNLSFIDTKGSKIEIIGSKLQEVRKSVSEYEIDSKPELNNLNNSETTEDITVVEPTEDNVVLKEQQYKYIAAIKTKPFLILGGFSGTGKSLQVKELAFATCPCDNVLNTSETSPGNYLLVSVKPNWHDATDITGFRSSVNNNYYVTDFMRFLVKAKSYEEKNVPFFVCLDEMNLAPVEEYFADFLSVIESRKRTSDGRIVTDPIVPASVFNAEYSPKFNIFRELGLRVKGEDWMTDDSNELYTNPENLEFERQDIVDKLKEEGLTIPQNVIIIGTVNMDDTTNTFSRKVIDRAMTFETVVGTFGMDYYANDVPLHYVKNPKLSELFISDEVRATDMIEGGRSDITEEEEKQIINFINGINKDMEGTPFKISYRILNETILLYHAKIEIKKTMEENGGFEDGVTFNTELNQIFDDIIMQKVLPRIEGDYEKCNGCLVKLRTRASENNWKCSKEKIQFMLDRFGSDKSGFTSFWN